MEWLLCNGDALFWQAGYGDAGFGDHQSIDMLVFPRKYMIPGFRSKREQ
jgi:hypothetical protein